MFPNGYVQLSRVEYGQKMIPGSKLLALRVESIGGVQCWDGEKCGYAAVQGCEILGAKGEHIAYVWGSMEATIRAIECARTRKDTPNA